MAVAPRSQTTRRRRAFAGRPTGRRARDAHRAGEAARAALRRQPPTEAASTPPAALDAPGQHPTPTLAQPPGARRPVPAMSDVTVAFLLTNEARYRAFERLGVRREDANVATLIMASMLADSAHRRLQWLLKARGRPTRADALVAAGVANELLHDLCGPASRHTPYFGGLVALALLLKLPGAAARRSLRVVRRASRRKVAGFRRRHGYLIAARPRRSAQRSS